VSRIVPNLWYTDKAEEAAAFYASILPNSKVDAVTALPADSPSGPAGSVKIVEFTLLGQPFMAFSAGPLDAFNHSISANYAWAADGPGSFAILQRSATPRLW
jgi:predicted 3-demethylubiquinone-9 3-methyltransferase (glyoxalase superfamily)